MIFKYNNDDLFDDSYFQFKSALGGRSTIANKVIYYSEKIVSELYWIDIEKDTNCNLYDIFQYKVQNHVPFNNFTQPIFYHSYETLYGYNKNITDLLRADDDNLRTLGYELFKKDLYKEFRKYFIPKFKQLKTQ